MTDTDDLPPATRVGRTALRVADLASTVEFYREVVGLAVHHRTDERATLGDGTTDLLVLQGDPDAPPRDRAAAGLFHTAFRVPSRAALSDALQRVRAEWSLDGASDHAVSEALYLSDPEGNGVEIYHDRPRSAWPVEDDGRVGMVTERLDLRDLAAESDGGSTVPEGTDVGHVHLEVTSLPTAGSFYTALGLRVRQRVGSDVVFLAAGDYHHHVGANVWQKRRDPAGGGHRGLNWFEFVVPDWATLDATATRLRSHGVDVSERGDGLAVSDPDGIRVRLRVEGETNGDGL